MNTPNSSQGDKSSELLKTPKSVGNKGTKRKLLSQSPSPSSPSEDGEKTGANKKRRKHSSSDKSPLASPGMKPALTERQQLAIVMQMTTPQKPEGGRVETIITPGSSGKGRLHRRNERGETPLHSACIKGDLATVETLLEQGADINTADNAGWTPLHEAANHGHEEVVTYLLKHGSNINASGMEGDTPLHDAVGNDHFSVARVLLELGADPHQPNDSGKTAIDLAKNNVNRAMYKLLTGEESLPACFLAASSIEVTPKAKVVHRKRRTSQELLLNVSIPLPPDSKFFQKRNKPCSEQAVPSKEVDTKAPPTRPDTLTKSHADYLYSDISSSDDWEFASPLFVSVDKKMVSSVVSEQQPIADLVKYSDISSPSDNSPFILNKLKNVNVAAEQSVSSITKVTTEVQSTEPAVTTAVGDGESDTVFLDPVTVHEDQSTEDTVDDESIYKQPVSEVMAVKSEENVIPDTAEEQTSANEVEQVTLDATPSNSKENIPTDSVTECIESEDPIPELKVKVEEDKKPLIVADDSCSVVDKDDKAKDKTLISSEAVPKSPIKVADKTLKLVTSVATKLLPDKTALPSTATKPPLLVKSITKPYQAPELQKLTTPFTIATSSFKTGGIDNKLPRSGIITKSLFLPSPTKGNSHNLNSTTKPQNSRGSPVRSSSSLVRTTSIVVPKPIPTMASSNSNKLTLSTIATKTTLSTIKTVNNGSTLSKTSTVSGISKPFQVSGTSKVLTATAPRTLTAPMVSKTLVVSSSTVKPNNTLTTSKQDSGSVKPLHQVQKAPVTSAVATVTTIPVTTMASTNVVASKTATPSTVTKLEIGWQEQHQQQSQSKHSEPTTTSKAADTLNKNTPPSKKIPYKLVRSGVVEKRRQPLPTKDLILPEGISTFLMCTGDHGNYSRKLDTEPKDVVPPISADLHSLFKQQQDERNDLITSHTIELERLQLSMEQELVRLYQQHCGRGAPPNACDALVEQLLPYWYAAGRSHNSSPVHASSKGDIEELVKEVWKRFYNLKISIVKRHKCEAEALHATQVVMWSGQLLALGTRRDASFRNIPSSHVPLIQ